MCMYVCVFLLFLFDSTSLSSAVESCPTGSAVFHGHSVRLGDLSDVNVLALIRSPIDRFISSYLFYKQGGYRGAHKRLSDYSSTQEASQALEYQQLAVSIISQELKKPAIIGSTEETNLKKKLAQLLDKLSYMIWAKKGDPLRAYDILLTAVQIYKSLGMVPESDINVRLALLSSTLQHPVHQFSTLAEFVAGLMRGDDMAWRALHCQENMIMLQETDREACTRKGSREVLRFHLAFRAQMDWLAEGSINGLRLMTFEDFTACATRNATVRTCLGVACDTHIPHMNGRARDHSDKSVTYISHNMREWLEQLYASDQSLYICVKEASEKDDPLYLQTSRSCLMNARRLLQQPPPIRYEVNEGEEVPGVWL